MKIDLRGERRSSWVVTNPLEFFKKLKSMFPQLEQNEIKEIEQRLEEQDPDYLEIPSYWGHQTPEPSMILIFENGNVSIDLLAGSLNPKIVDKITTLVGNSGSLKTARPLTQNDWMQRLEVLDSLL